jgi:RNA polymerase sigma factor (TIGR02999 family)
MTQLTQILAAIDRGETVAAEQLLPLVYDELRKLAAQKLAHEKPGITLQATALVHEAYLRLVNQPEDSRWQGRGHFFSAAAEAMRRILVDEARRRGRQKRGGGLAREELIESQLAISDRGDDLLALDEGLELLTAADPQACELVKLRYFAGLTLDEAAEALGISPRKADSLWAYARAWLRERLESD